MTTTNRQQMPLEPKCDDNASSDRDCHSLHCPAHGKPAPEPKTTTTKCGQVDDDGNWLCQKARGHFGCHRGGLSVWLRSDTDTCAPLDVEATAQFVRDHTAPLNTPLENGEMNNVWYKADGFGAGMGPDEAREQDLDYSHIRDSSPEAYEQMAICLSEMGYPKPPRTGDADADFLQDIVQAGRLLPSQTGRLEQIIARLKAQS